MTESFVATLTTAGAIFSSFVAAGWVQQLPRTGAGSTEIVKIAKPTVEISDKVRLNLEKFVWSS